MHWLGVALWGGVLALAPRGDPREQQTRRWVTQVLRKEAPRLDAAHRERVAKAVAHEARVQRVEPDLILSVMKVESGFNPHAQSRQGALGLMQVMPVSAAHVSGRRLSKTAIYDVETNIRLGTSVLRDVLRKHRGNLDHALGAYNLGTAGFRHALRAKKSLGFAKKVLAVRQRMAQDHPMARAEAPRGGRGTRVALVEPATE